jgi:hypothetical protein
MKVKVRILMRRRWICVRRRSICSPTAWNLCLVRPPALWVIVEAGKSTPKREVVENHRLDDVHQMNAWLEVSSARPCTR